MLQKRTAGYASARPRKTRRSHASTSDSSLHVLDLLRRYESRNVTAIEPDGSWPIVWERARGMHVWDAEGRRYLDFTAAFGVAAAGHANPRVVAAGQHQMRRLLHAMGDVHPHALKAQLARVLSGLTFERWTGRTHGRTIFCNSGFEAVEAALKTALLATGRKDILAFEGGYHGLGYGALNATHRAHFRQPFLTQLARFGHFISFPTETTALARTFERMEALARRHAIGAVLVEPVQVRGGIYIPHPDFLPGLRQFCNRTGALLVLDEIYTGFGRTGRWFACEHAGVAPDLICLGKALTGGFPLSACVGRADVMDAAWPPSSGEAIHTSTFLGHPVGCAMALAQIEELRQRKLCEHAADMGVQLLALLQDFSPPPGHVAAARGLGLLAGLELRQTNGTPSTALVLSALNRLLRLGFVLLPEGPGASVLAFTPPLIVSSAQCRQAVAAVGKAMKAAPV